MAEGIVNLLTAPRDDAGRRSAPRSRALLGHGTELLWPALRFRAGSLPLSGLDHEIVSRIRLQIPEPDGVIVAAGILVPAPRLFGGFRQSMRTGAILHDAAAGGVGRPGNLGHRTGCLLHLRTGRNAFCL